MGFCKSTVKTNRSLQQFLTDLMIFPRDFPPELDHCKMGLKLPHVMVDFKVDCYEPPPVDSW